MEKYTKINLPSLIKSSVPQPLFDLSPEKTEKLKTYSNVLLAILSTATVLTMAVLAPNALRALDIFQKKKGAKRLGHNSKVKKVTRAFYYLRHWGYIDFQPKGDDYEVVFKTKGKKLIKRLNLETLTVSKPSKWDGRFWQIAADIPTKNYRRGADALRDKLKELEFYPLQRTLWFYPFDPRIEVEFIARSYGIANFVTVMKIELLDPSDENILRGHFQKNGII